mgnify:CR=1 FL=1|jgi:hypothetical protein|tara:strand:- start:2060 stop:2689 length:630 start_codon:yes stop_codon:yes gene_type:complete
MNQEEINLVMTLVEQVSANSKNVSETKKIWQRFKDLESIIENVNIQSRLQEGSDTVLNAYIKRTNALDDNFRLLSKKIEGLKANILHLQDCVNPQKSAWIKSDFVSEQLRDKPDIKKDWKSKSLTDVLQESNVRVLTLLYETLKLDTLGDLFCFTQNQLLTYKNFGRHSLASLKRDLKEIGMELPKGDEDDEQYIDLTLSKEEAIERNL